MHLEPEEFLEQVSRIGCAISGHSKQLAPAEGRFYKLRDVTGTVPSTELITASIVLSLIHICCTNPPWRSFPSTSAGQ